MAEKVSPIKPRHLALAGVVLVSLQLGLVAWFDFKPPQFKAGFHVAEEDVVIPEATAPTAYERLQQLEAILSPAPILAWAKPATDYAIPDIIAPEVVLGFGSAGQVTPQSDEPAAEDETIQLALAQPAARLRIKPPAETDSLSIEPVYIESLPDLTVLDVKQRKKQFIAFMLPLILRANQELEERRARIEMTYRSGNTVRLRQWAELYNFNPENMSNDDIHAELLRRVYPVPVSIALAQGAIESGWGTSRFAIQGNAIYGQWAWSAKDGIKPKEARYENAVVRSFSHLFDSVRAYMHNLNTHAAYERFRVSRAENINAPLEDRIPAMLETLDQYSEKREVYIDMLVDIMNDNDLWLYEKARLAVE